ncbi:MAG: Na/Pi cotransporter family protein [Clostridia bacterium]|nr:Na/Pi cotransporter family protein [Clostridia bacterium]
MDNVIFKILSLVGGLALFLYGMDVMGDGLKKLAGGRMEMILAKLTSNPLKGFLLGFGVTAIIQSSSATTVMLVGFVNSGIMKLGQTISIIMGANVGTTVTSWLLSTSGIEGDAIWLKLLKPSSFTPILAVIGVAITMFSKSDKKKNIATILLGFAVLMFGMEAMSGAVSGLKNNDTFKEMLIMFENPFMGILMGTILTAVIQSSSASVGILQALATTGTIPFAMAIPIIMGQNIGTTITPILSAISGNRDSKRVAFACLLIKMLGVIIVAPVFYILHAFVNFAFMDSMIDPFWIAIIHTLFNILTTVVLIPFCGFIEKCSIKAVRGKKNQKEEEKNDAFSALDERFISIPSFAIDTSRHLVCDMALLAQRSFESAAELIENYDKSVAERVGKEETEVDRYEDKISSYLVKVSGQDLTAKDSREVTSLLHCVGDIERISDHAVNICEAAEEIKEKGIEFSSDAKHDIEVISAATREVLLLAVRALMENNLEIAKKVEPLEQVIDKLKRKIKNNHIKRLKEGNCTMEYGFVLSDLLTNFERVADHCSNIAVCLLEIAQGALDTHEYLSHVKEDGENEFFELYDQYKAKYTL